MATSYELMEAYFKASGAGVVGTGSQGNGFTSSPGSATGTTSTPTHVDNTYFLHTLSLTTKSGAVIDIINSLISIEIFEDIFSKSIHGYVELKDVAGILSAAYITGGEFLELSVLKPRPSSEIIISRKDFVIHQISKVEFDGQNSMTYKLHFMPASAVEAQKKRIYKSFKTTRSILDVIKLIYADVSGALKLYSKANDLPVMQKSFVSPGYTPYEAIDSLTKRACYNGDYFLFFERLNLIMGGNHVFSSINNLRTFWSTEAAPPMILYQPKLSNITSQDAGALLAASVEIQENFDHINNMNAGFYNSNLRMLDVLARRYYDINLNYSQIQDAAKAGKFIQDGNIFLTYNQSYPETPGERLITRANNDVFANKTTWVRTDVFGSVLLSNMRLNVTIPGGNNLVGAGTMVDLKLPSFFAKTMNLGSGINQNDNVYAGKYIVTAVRHTLTPTEYTKRIELSRDSGNISLKYTLNQLNNSDLLNPQSPGFVGPPSQAPAPVPAPAPATRPPAPAPAPTPAPAPKPTTIGGFTLPADWYTKYTAAQKIAWYNEKNISPQTLLNAGATQAEIDWMRNVANPPYTATGAPRPTSIAGLTLPANWYTEYTGAMKIAWFNEKNVGPQVLLDAGVTQAEIDWMRNVAKPPYTATGVRRPTVIGGFTLPADWYTKYTAEQKIAWYNEKNISPQALLDVGVSQADIDWARNVAVPPYTATGALRPTGVALLTLPKDWYTKYTAAMKIAWFNENDVGPQDLLDAGVTQEEIDWMQNTAKPAYKGKGKNRLNRIP